MSKVFFFSLLIASGLIINEKPALAGWGKFTLTDEDGETVEVKHGLFSHKTIVHDRLGNTVERSKGIFGINRNTQVSVLGNSVTRHKGLLGSRTEVHSMLGDSATSKKNLFYRNTNVNVKGASSLLKDLFKPKQTGTPLMPPPSENYIPPMMPSTSMPNSMPAPNLNPAKPD